MTRRLRRSTFDSLHKRGFVLFGAHAVSFLLLWTRAVAGPLRGAELRALPAVDHFWFSWAAFFPETEIYRASA
jgi:hypothetical protein